jgi:hypothetical protein
MGGVLCLGGAGSLAACETAGGSGCAGLLSCAVRGEQPRQNAISAYKAIFAILFKIIISTVEMNRINGKMLFPLTAYIEIVGLNGFEQFV